MDSILWTNRKTGTEIVFLLTWPKHFDRGISILETFYFLLDYVGVPLLLCISCLYWIPPHGGISFVLQTSNFPETYHVLHGRDTFLEKPLPLKDLCWEQDWSDRHKKGEGCEQVQGGPLLVISITLPPINGLITGYNFTYRGYNSTYNWYSYDWQGPTLYGCLR